MVQTWANLGEAASGLMPACSEAPKSPLDTVINVGDIAVTQSAINPEAIAGIDRELSRSGAALGSIVITPEITNGPV
ncbi:MAG TPA: hypothetical protein VGS08_04950 [Candidatus Saccharimonadales bacterium]|nr:hypothetical protein [Candidatus Saccharimonadales bacterium]